MCECWKQKFEMCMWNVCNLKFWAPKCLNWDLWILKAKTEISNFKFPCDVENLKIEMFKFGCVNIESWKLKTKMSEYWKLKTKN